MEKIKLLEKLITKQSYKRRSIERKYNEESRKRYNKISRRIEILTEILEDIKRLE